MFVAMHVNSPLTRDILGRIYAVRVMLSNPEEIEPFLDDRDFLLYVGEQEYERIKPFYDEMTEGARLSPPPIPPNKSARSQQWETKNQPSDLNKACLAAKSSLIRTAQTDHEIQADAQDSQD